MSFFKRKPKIEPKRLPNDKLAALADYIERTMPQAEPKSKRKPTSEPIHAYETFPDYSPDVAAAPSVARKPEDTRICIPECAPAIDDKDRERLSGLREALDSGELTVEDISKFLADGEVDPDHLTSPEKLTDDDLLIAIRRYSELREKDAERRAELEAHRQAIENGEFHKLSFGGEEPDASRAADESGDGEIASASGGGESEAEDEPEQIDGGQERFPDVESDLSDLIQQYSSIESTEKRNEWLDDQWNEVRRKLQLGKDDGKKSLIRPEPTSKRMPEGRPKSKPAAHDDETKRREEKAPPVASIIDFDKLIKKKKSEKAARLQAEQSLADRLGELDESFQEMLLRKIDELGMSDTECYKNAFVDRKLFSKIRKNRLYHPEKDTAIRFAIALRLPLAEMREMLEKAGYALSHSNKFDVIVEYYVSRGVYDVYEINDALWSFDQPLLIRL